MRHRVKACLLAIGLLLAFHQDGAAQSTVGDDVIVAFNDALGSGDRVSIVDASAALGDAAMAHPDDPLAGVMAYEAAAQLATYGEFASAVGLAAFAVTKDTDDRDVQAQRLILLRYAEWSLADDKQTRKALDEALEAGVSSPPTTPSVIAYWKRMSVDAAAGDNRSLAATARWTSAHFEQARSVLFERWAIAELFQQVTEFNETQAVETAMGLAELQDGMKVELAAIQAAGGVPPDWWEGTYFKAEAWRMAVGAYFNSIGERKYDDDAVDAVSERTPMPAGRFPTISPTGEERLPFCFTGTVNQDPPLRYPYRAARRGMFGAVILRIETDDEGRVINPEVLAAVPEEGFSEKVIETALKWRMDDTQMINGPCRKSRTNIVIPFVFEME